MQLSDDQRAEVDKYAKVYKIPNYRMGDARFLCASDNLASVDHRGGYLDVGCGRGEMLQVARALGYQDVQGAEVVDYLVAAHDNVRQAPAWDLPFDDNAFDVVSLFDVIEHLRPEDAEPTCRELARVARKTVFITAANYSSKSLGEELHVNRQSYDAWDTFFRAQFVGAKVTWLARSRGINSETWRITLDGGAVDLS